ncbi:MAG TPA: SDR family oxidoreductase, partial [Longimicrobium sp.]|nr:SDR family oxidoreductase [Longimicrobium sp.]
VVAGATRGAGRGVARMLGEAGATVYCTGRGSRGRPSSEGAFAGRPETVEETAEMVDAAGGRGIPVRVDHREEGEVAALFARVGREAGRVDVLVNAFWGGPGVAWGGAFADYPLETGRAMLDAVWPHVLTCRHAVPLLRRGGLIVQLTEHDTLGFRGNVFYDLGRIAEARLAHALAEELAPKGITALALTPGFIRTEAVLDTFGATEADWREVAERDAKARSFGLAGSETPCFVGRAVAALAADPEAARWSGGLLSSWALSDAYGFADVDGARPHWGRYFAENFPAFANASPKAAFRWEVAPAKKS